MSFHVCAPDPTTMLSLFSSQSPRPRPTTKQLFSFPPCSILMLSLCPSPPSPLLYLVSTPGGISLFFEHPIFQSPPIPHPPWHNFKTVPLEYDFISSFPSSTMLSESVLGPKDNLWSCWFSGAPLSDHSPSTGWASHCCPPIFLAYSACTRPCNYQCLPTMNFLHISKDLQRRWVKIWGEFLMWRLRCAE